MESKAKSLYQIKVTLDTIQPPIWRRFLVPDTLTLYQLHAVLQVVMGWSNSHLHLFRINGQEYGDPIANETGMLELKDENRYKLNRLITGEGFGFKYEYDFGDSWEHTLLVEKIQSPEVVAFAPVCLKGKRSAPPEDVGGVPGYYAFLEAMNDPKHPEHDQMLEWHGGEFAAEAFDADATNHELELLVELQYDLEAFFEAIFEIYDSDEDDPDLDEMRQHLGASETILVSYLESLSDEHLKTAEELALRRDMVTLLTYLQTHPVKATTTGLLPLKAVREICAQFVNPPTLDHQLGDKLYKLRSEQEVFPLEFLHALAHVNHFVESAPNRKYQLEGQALVFLSLPSIMQVIQLFMGWVASVNWQISYPFAGLRDSVTGDSQIAAFRELVTLPPATPIPFEPFAEKLTSVTGWQWFNNDKDMLYNAVEYKVINRLIDFGAATAEYGPHPILKEPSKKIVSFQITPFGHDLMGLLNRITTSFPHQNQSSS